VATPAGEIIAVLTDSGGHVAVDSSDVTVEIVTFEPDQEIAWTMHRQPSHVHGYLLKPIEEGTLVTSDHN
jgi:hypothetical protein